MLTYIGIDWSSQKHDICFVNAAGAAIARQVIAHTPAGFAEFERQRQRLGVEPAECVIGIETAHNLLVDYLWGHHYSQVYVIPPNQVNRESQARAFQFGGELVHNNRISRGGAPCPRHAPKSGRSCWRKLSRRLMNCWTGPIRRRVRT